MSFKEFLKNKEKKGKRINFFDILDFQLKNNNELSNFDFIQKTIY